MFILKHSWPLSTHSSIFEFILLSLIQALLFLPTQIEGSSFLKPIASHLIVWVFILNLIHAFWLKVFMQNRSILRLAHSWPLSTHSSIFEFILLSLIQALLFLPTQIEGSSFLKPVASHLMVWVFILNLIHAFWLKVFMQNRSILRLAHSWPLSTHSSIFEFILLSLIQALLFLPTQIEGSSFLKPVASHLMVFVFILNLNSCFLT